MLSYQHLNVKLTKKKEAKKKSYIIIIIVYFYVVKLKDGFCPVLDM